MHYKYQNILEVLRVKAFMVQNGSFWSISIFQLIMLNCSLDQVKFTLTNAGYFCWFNFLFDISGAVTLQPHTHCEADPQNPHGDK